MGKNETERDVAAINECTGCQNFEPFQRRLNQNRAKLYKMLEDEENQDLVKINCIRRCLKIIKDLLETPTRLQEKINTANTINNQKMRTQMIQNRKLQEINR